MLRNLKSLCFLLPTLLFIACDRCIHHSFADPFAFNIVNKSTGKDLIFGTSPVYNPDSIYFLNNPSGYGNGSSLGIRSNYLSWELVEPTDTLFLRLTPTDTDTLLLSYKYIEGHCCNSPKGFGQLRSIKYNKNIAIKNKDDIYVLKK